MVLKDKIKKEPPFIDLGPNQSARPDMTPSSTPSPVVSPSLAPFSQSSSNVIVSTPVPATTFLGNIRDLPTATPYQKTIFTGSSDQIVVVANKSSYKMGDKITITISNNSNSTLSYYLGPSCGIFFQRQVNSDQWVSQNITYSLEGEAPCQLKTLGSREKVEVTYTIDKNPPVGRYRIGFKYLEGEVYSSTFEIF